MTQQGGENDNDSLVNYMKKEFTGIKDKLKSDDSLYTQFTMVSKSKVFQDAKMFHDQTLVTRNPRKCIDLLEQILYLIIVKGEEIMPSEATDLFFGVTKLFLSPNKALRRMIYQFIKEMSDATSSEEIIIVVSCLIKDVNNDEDLYRGNSIRVLCKILVDPGYISQINRFIVQAVVHKNALVASSALISGYHLMERVPEIVRRWVNEVQEASRSSNDMVQFHALLLLYCIKQGDPVGISRLLSQSSKSDLKSPLALCLLVRYAKVAVLGNADVQTKQELVLFLERCLHHPSDMVMLESIRALVDISEFVEVDLTVSLQVLQNFLSSTKSYIRFAAVRTLSRLALRRPADVARCNSELESLIKDPNKSIGTLAITALLKTSPESGVDRLLVDISSFLSEVPDDNKTLITAAIHDLTIKFPKKNQGLLQFLGGILKEAGGFEFKKSIVHAMLDVIRTVPESKEACFEFFCEFIEDCDFPVLTVEILHILGEQGPRCSQAASFIRYIYNRYILETPTVRCAAVSALGQFALHCQQLEPALRELLTSCLSDSHPEVRDRAHLLLFMLDQKGSQQEVLSSPLPSAGVLYQALLAVKQMPLSKGAITLKTLPLRQEALPPAFSAAPVAASISSRVNLSAASATAAAVDEGLAHFQSVSAFKDLGELLSFGALSFLTPKETEYIVSVRKYVLREAMVFQYAVINTLDDQILDSVRVSMDLQEGDEPWTLVTTVPSGQISHRSPGYTYTLLKYPAGEESPYPSAVFAAEMNYTVKNIDSQTGEPDEGDEEDYNLEDVTVGAGDFIAKSAVKDFQKSWDSVMGCELTDQFVLTQKTVYEAVEYLQKKTNMKACEGTQSVKPASNTHKLLLSGKTIDDVAILALCQVSLTKEHGIVLQVSVHSTEESGCQLFVECLE